MACLEVTEIVKRLADKDVPSLVEWAAFVYLGMSLLLNNYPYPIWQVVPCSSIMYWCIFNKGVSSI